MAKARQQVSIANFGGVDFSSPLLSVADSRAIDILNFIRKNGVNQKRKGWEQVAVAPDFQYEKQVSSNGTLFWNTFDNPKTFNGMWQFIGEDGDTHIIAHIGKALFIVEGLGQDMDFTDVTFTPLTKIVDGHTTLPVDLIDEKTNAVASGNRLYILGGSKYLMLRFYIDDGANCYDLCAVEDSKYVYVPTTSIGITYADSPVSIRSLLDDVNLLSTLRKNKLLSGTLFEANNVVRTTRFFEYELDTDIDSDDKTDDSFEIELQIRQVEEDE